MSFAVFFVVHFAAAILVNCAAPAAIRLAEAMRARAAARFLFTIRMLPSGIALFAVSLLCIPSYLWLEPAAQAEHVGWFCLILAIAGVATIATSIFRAGRAIFETRRWVGAHLEANTIASAGILRPRVLISERVRRALSPEELDAAAGHERAHATSNDNLKRLLVMAAPEILPFTGSRFRAIESARRRFCEWAADDDATNGDPQRSVALASALVRVAQLDLSAPPPLITSLTDIDLSRRVERLLNAQPRGAADHWTPAIATAATIAAAAVIAQPAALAEMYELLEKFIQ
jgi:hypothetical protein